MCGIIAVVRRRSDRATPTSDELVHPLEGAAERLSAAPASELSHAIAGVAERVEQVDRLLRGTAGIAALLGDRSLPAVLASLVAEIGAALASVEGGLDDDPAPGAALEAVNAAVIRLKDGLWAIERDRLRSATAVADLAGATPTPSAIEAFASVQAALSALDRLEVRGRDSAGLMLLVHGHGIDVNEPALAALLAARAGDPLFTSGAVRVTPEGHLSFVYKAAAEIGELGDNSAVLRAAIRGDALLHLAVAGEGAEVTVLGHTRWASIGIISQPNAHPMNSDEVGRDSGPYVTAALNGDVDNLRTSRSPMSCALPPRSRATPRSSPRSSRAASLLAMSRWTHSARP